MNRFFNASDSDIEALKEASSSKNTKRSTLNWLQLFNKWKETHTYTQEIHTYEPKELNVILERFYAELRKTDGKDYEPTCLRVMLSSLDR